MVGATFAGVQVERILGSGGMGRVYLGTDVEQQRRVALKVLLRTQRDESVRKRFDREARLLEKLRHPSIAAVLRSGVEQDADIDIPYIVMEYVEGVQTIADWTFRERLGAREAVELLLQACDGVGHAHREGYIHRDLKPANILVDRHGRVKVIDFGVARAVSVDAAAVTVRTETGQIVGTMQYMSPEQFRADPRAVDARTDVYALGAVLFELLAGVQPHELRGAPVHEAARIVCETDAPDVRKFNPRVDGRLAAIVADTLAREPSRRPDDANALALRLRGWLEGGTAGVDGAGIDVHPDVEFRAQSGVVRGERAAIAGLGGGGGGVRAAPAVQAAPGRGVGSWVLVAFVALVAAAAGPRAWCSCRTAATARRSRSTFGCRAGRMHASCGPWERRPSWR
jgi:serine/threonine protein kinase